MSGDVSFVTFILPASLGCGLASLMAVRLRLKYPELHKAIGEPVATDWHPTWIYRFVARRQYNGIDRLSIAIAWLSCVLMAFGWIAFAYIVQQGLSNL